MVGVPPAPPLPEDLETLLRGLELLRERISVDDEARQALIVVQVGAFLGYITFGWIADRIGRRPVLVIGLAGSTIFYTLFGIATVYKSLLWLFVARIGAGISGATILGDGRVIMILDPGTLVRAHRPAEPLRPRPEPVASNQLAALVVDGEPQGTAHLFAYPTFSADGRQ